MQTNLLTGSSIMEQVAIDINSEIGVLEGVVIHTPGSEVENMTPNMVQKALYSDILNLSVAGSEYNQFSKVLEKVTRTFQVKDLLFEILKIGRASCRERV